MIAYDSVEAGLELLPVRVALRRADLVRYAGASGDFNPIHWNPSAAAALGLPDVIAHGMLTMAGGARVLTEWVGDPARILEYSVRFTKPVVVPDTEDGAELLFGGKVAAKLDDGRVRVDLTATCGDDKIFGAARAVVQLD